MSSRTLYGCTIFLRRECHSVCLLMEVFSGPKIRTGRTDFTLFSYLYVSAGILIRQSGYFADESKSLCWNQLR